MNFSPYTLFLPTARSLMQFPLHKKRVKFWRSFIHIIDFTSHLLQEQLILCTFTHIRHLQTNLVSQIVISVWYSLGEKLFLHSIIYFLFIFCKKQIQFGPTKTTFFTCFSHFIFLLSSFFRFTFYHPKNIGNLYPSRSQVATVYSLVSQRYLSLSCINKVPSLLFLAASWEFYDVFHKVLIMKVLWSEREIFSLKIK